MDVIHAGSLFLRPGRDIYDVIKRFAGGLCIDGGAAMGAITRKLLVNPSMRVIAFEPFPGNAPLFVEQIGASPRVEFRAEALGSSNRTQSFYVQSTVTSASWAPIGYSSIGCLVDEQRAQASPESKLYAVKVVRLDEIVSDDILLLKLDLQGGELDALKGCSRLFDKKKVKTALIEWTGSRDIIDFLHAAGFVIFDSEILTQPKNPDWPAKVLQSGWKSSVLSTGATAASGFLKETRRDVDGYCDTFSALRTDCVFVQTDLVAIHASYLSEFLDVATRVPS